jgi:hypothetical protein
MYSIPGFVTTLGLLFLFTLVLLLSKTEIGLLDNSLINRDVLLFEDLRLKVRFDDLSILFL